MLSFESSELIKELKEDIVEFGGDKIVAVWCRKIWSKIFYVNYDFIDEENPIEKNELEDDEYIQTMTMSALLVLLEKQNEL